MRLTVVDTLSTIFFFTILAAVTELYVAGMEHAKVLKIRAVMIPMMILTGRPYGAWRSERPWSETRGPMIGGPGPLACGSTAWIGHSNPCYQSIDLGKPSNTN